MVTKASEPSLKTIEEMAHEAGVDKSVLAGVKVNEGWSTGKRVTEKQFESAVKKFLKQPLGGKGVK